jgi:ATP-dependent DNA helicase RecG
MLLSDPVTTIPLIGKSHANRLQKLDIETVEDLLHHYPFRYNDFSRRKKINELVASETVTVTATVLEIKAIYTRGGRRLTRATVADETGELLVVWFNPYVTKNIKKGDRVNLSGSLGKSGSQPAFVSPEYEVLNKESRIKNEGRNIHTGRLVPIYPETRGVTSKWLRSRINITIQQFKHLITSDVEFLPNEIREQQNLIDLKTAINQIHFPENQDEIDQARKRLAFDELFLMQIKALKRRAEWQQKPLAHEFRIKNKELRIKEFIKSLPFELTNAQKRAVDEILKDLEKDAPMNRLLEGDVGSGKTVVAAVAIYAAHLNGFQSALMAPTEVLAEQHYKEVTKMLEPFGVGVSLRTGSVAATHASPSIFIGTHALLFDSVQFENLGLVVIDEQHRFGVKQRAKLLKKVADDKVPHLLTMTATPIPRSLALTAYGDLDLSVLDEMPPGRKEVITWVVPNRKRGAAYNWIRKQITGKAAQSAAATVAAPPCGARTNQTQAFVICPLIEESEAETMQSVKAATVEYERLSKEIFPDLRLALLHGKVKSQEKNKILEDFKNGKYDILVSTQVVEVGIDVPTATLMIIEGAERFGLASLHQLRGRVGRSDQQSYCLLFTSPRTRGVYRRLKAMEDLNDGFKLAEVDLKMRGPGEIYGVKQHGIKEFKIASLSDVKLIETTRSEAKKILEEDSELKNHPALKSKLERVSSELVEPN